MECKTVEIRDRATFIPALAVRLVPATERDRYLLFRAGFSPDPQKQGEYIYLVRIAGGTGRATCDPYDWEPGARTMRVAHQHLIEHWAELETGALIDVAYLLGETEEPKVSESTA